MSLSKLLFSFKGRIPRSTFWYYVIGYVIVIGVAMLLDAALGTLSDRGYGPISGLLSLLGIFPGLAVDVKRAHDRDHSGWYVLILLIPIVGVLWLLIEFGFLKGSAGPNKYGDDPTGRAGPSRVQEDSAAAPSESPPPMGANTIINISKSSGKR